MDYSSNPHIVWALARQRQSELLHEAEQHRLAKLARPMQKTRFSLTSQVCWVVGRALVSSGLWLLSRPVSFRRSR